MPVGSTPLDNFNSWEEVTVENVTDRDGPCLKRIAVPGGWLYLATDPSSLMTSPAPVFVLDDRS